MKKVVHSADAMYRFIGAALKPLGETFEKPQMVVVEDYKPPKTSKQNRKMHAMWRELANFVGFSEKEVKQYFKDEWGPASEKPVKIGGKERILRKSVADYTREDCMHMIEHIYRVGAESGYLFEDE